MKALVGLGVLVGFVSTSFAVDSNSLEAFDNATVQPGGPRSGTAGKNFFNVEGIGLGTFASYGVIDFDGSALSFSEAITGVTALRIDLTQSNAAFTANGSLKFWLTSDITTDIQPGTSALILDASTPYGIAAGDLEPLFELGTGAFVQVSTGTVDSYTFNVSGAAADLLTTSVADGSTIRLVITQDAGDDTVAATWAGFSNASLAGPTLTLTGEPVPEPASLAALSVGALALLRRRKQSK